jgi:hypothetical protein
MKAFPTHREEGMELRDYFAAKAMAALIHVALNVMSENEDIDIENEGINKKDVCLYCYEWADAMMEARNESL